MRNMAGWALIALLVVKQSFVANVIALSEAMATTDASNEFVVPIEKI